MKSRIPMLTTLLLSLCTLFSSAHAEVICVGTAAQLRAALTAAASSPEASEIRVRKGFYSLPAASANAVSLQYFGNSDLKMTGGWDGNTPSLCTDQMTRGLEDTVLSADGVGRLLNIFLFTGASTQIELGLLSFRQGNSDNTNNSDAACLTIESDASSDAVVRIDRNSFRLCNRMGGTGSALVVIARSMDLYLRGNLLLDNANSSGAVFLQGLGGSTFYVSNNSLANNPQFGAGGGPAGMQISTLGTDFVWFSNNVLWNNGTGSGYDLLVGANTPMVLNNNLIGAMASLPGGVVNNNTLSVNPGFNNNVDLRPRGNSPLRDSGVNPTGGALVLDFDSNTRVFGPRIDRGAFEFVNLFENGFE